MGATRRRIAANDATMIMVIDSYSVVESSVGGVFFRAAGIMSNNDILQHPLRAVLSVLLRSAYSAALNSRLCGT